MFPDYLSVSCTYAEANDDMYWNIPLNVSIDDEVDQSESYPDVNSGKQYHGSSQFENDFPLFARSKLLDV